MREETLHITLHFLGDVEATRMDELRDLLRAATEAKCVTGLALEIAGAGFFPQKRRPRVVQVGIEPSNALMPLHGSVGRALQERGFVVEDRRYRPHITIAKIGRRVQADSIEAIRRRVKDHKSFGQQAFSIDEVRLVASELTPNGSIYTDIEVVPLES